MFNEYNDNKDIQAIKIISTRVVTRKQDHCSRSCISLLLRARLAQLDGPAKSFENQF